MRRIRLLQDFRASATGFAMAETYAGEFLADGSAAALLLGLGGGPGLPASQFPHLGNPISPTEGG
jgi:hypothetical protein